MTITMYACQNCSWTGPVDDLKSISDVFERIAEGERMPAGECPKCAALCHAEDDGEAGYGDGDPDTAYETGCIGLEPRRSQTATVASSHGDFTICLTTGDVLTFDQSGDDLSGIYRFDLPEWERFWRKPLPASFDILDLAYWTRVPCEHGSAAVYVVYEPAEDDWRQQIAKALLGRRQGEDDQPTGVVGLVGNAALANTLTA